MQQSIKDPLVASAMIIAQIVGILNKQPNERRMISPVRRQGGSNPIVIGNQGQPLVRVGNPNPNNRWHNKSRQNSNGRFSQSNQQGSQDFRNLHSRNAPLQQQDFRPQTRYNRNADSDRRFQSNDYSRPQYQNSGFNRPQYQNNGYNRSQYQNNGYNNGFNQNKGNLQHNLQFRTNPPAIYQKITWQELNSICVECPQGVEEHTKAKCPNFTVFQKAPTKGNQT